MGAHHTTKNNKITWIQTVHEAKKQLQTKYRTSHGVIGKGAFGKVYKGTSLHSSKTKVAIKAFKKKQLYESDIKAVEQEINVLSCLDHPNIVKYYEAIIDDKNIYIVTEFVKGQTLTEKIRKDKRPFREEEAMSILHQLASSINHCHSKGIVHRDIKPANIMIDEKMNVTLIDFGLSKDYSKKKLLESSAGSPLYMAPEVMDSKYTEKWDVWSFGVIMYILLSNNMPFTGKTVEEILNEARCCDLALDTKLWDSISHEAIDLISRTICVDTKHRLDIKQVLAHDWFNQISGDSTDDSNPEAEREILDSLWNFSNESLFKRACLNLLAHNIKLYPNNTIKQDFFWMDTKNNGMISSYEIKNAFDKTVGEISDKDAKQIIEAVDLSGDNHITYTEFWLAAMAQSELLSLKNIQILFKIIDSNNVGYITKDDMLREFSKICRSSSFNSKSIFRDVGINKNSTITFIDFKYMLTST
jgi:calcium-dependent protein kinase